MAVRGVDGDPAYAEDATDLQAPDAGPTAWSIPGLYVIVSCSPRSMGGGPEGMVSVFPSVRAW
ncbi:hypothetical protein IQ62_27655 [Streptomyces scabiei]|nr:hypothetical protein IQ62_27655 [Streptomyces scabiei]